MKKVNETVKIKEEIKPTITKKDNLTVKFD